MNAEIEFIKVYGSEYAALECLPCRVGFAPSGSETCSSCEANQYLDVTGDVLECKHCPQYTFSFAGSIGQEACTFYASCDEADIAESMTACQNGNAIINY